jgi:DNA methyltransferase 1-associated protein 1
MATHRRAARWTREPAAAAKNEKLHHWVRNGIAPPIPATAIPNEVPVPEYDDSAYEAHLTHSAWTREETDYLVQTYRSCNGKWPVIADNYDYHHDHEADTPPSRTMEDLKARFYSISATLLQLSTPITSMTTTDYSLYEMLSSFNPTQETSRKKLAEGHLYRRSNEVDEETVLLGELQRIMLNQATLDNQREELRQRLDHPRAATAGYQYATSQALTTLWQQLLSQDRAKKHPKLRPTGHATYDGLPSIPNAANASRPSGGSAAPPAQTPTTLPDALSKSDQARFGVTTNVDKTGSSVTFLGDRFTKPRTAKSQIQTEKLAAILANIGVHDVIPMATPPVVAVFEQIMEKVHLLMDLRKAGEKDSQEVRVRQNEVSS